MANNSTNGASYLILNSLSSGSKYGLEIIESISQRTGGHYIMKKPTLYSALTRMEKKGLVSSSYWQTSEMGGKRHYYTITNAGKKELEMLEIEFKDVSFDDLDEDSSEASSNETFAQTNQQVSKDETEDVSRTVVGWQDNLFNIVGQKKEENTESSETESETADNQMDLFSYQNSQTAETSSDASQEQKSADTLEETNENQQKMEYYQSILEQQPTYLEADSQYNKDDAVLLGENERITNAQEQQNQRIYDNSSDLKHYRKRKSFAENQIEMSVEYEREEDREIQKERIENLKNSLLNFRQNKNEQILTEQESVKENAPSEQSQTAYSPLRNFDQDIFSQIAGSPSNAPVNQQEEQPRIDDAVFITSRYSENEIPIQKKITPPNIDIDVTDDNLPAPKRNTNLEPTYKDMMAKLYERKKEKEKQREENTSQTLRQPQVVPNQAQTPASQDTYTSYESGNYNDMDSFVDYGSLQRYYADRGIEFREYKKSSVQRNHNTNFLQFISSVVLLLLSGVGCTVIFGIVAGAHLLNANSNFLFYTIPCIFLLYTIFMFVRDRIYASKKALITYNAVINWAVFLLSLVVILVANIICGMQYEIFGQFLTSILVPAYAMLLAFPCNYYIKKFLYKKYAR